MSKKFRVNGPCPREYVNWDEVSSAVGLTMNEIEKRILKYEFPDFVGYISGRRVWKIEDINDYILKTMEII
jgi:predicted DNA-binding transcriptional regulator AlpA